MVESENRQERIERSRVLLETMLAKFKEYCSTGRLDLARQKYEQAKEVINSQADEQPELQYFLTLNPLIRAYLMEGKFENALELFSKENKTLAERTKDRELQETCLAFSEINDVWKLHAEVVKLAAKYRNKELQQQFVYIISRCCGESILDYSKGGKVDEAQAVYENLKHLVETHGKG